MDRSWMNALRTSKAYEIGVEEFIEFAKRNTPSENGMYFCPCKKCLNRSQKSVDDIRDHLFCNGINHQYKNWVWHGELGTTTSSTSQNTTVVDDVVVGRMEDMINDIEAESSTPLSEYEKLRSDAETPLYPGCHKYSRLTGVLTLLNIKASNGWADAGFSVMLEALSDMFPDNNVLPKGMYEAKKVIKKIDMECKKIDACSNDCILYRNEYDVLTKCPKCNTPRYKVRKDINGDEESKSPSKVMWYLPIVPRFKRLFSNVQEAKNLRWHYEGKISDGFLRHPADSPQWKKIDEMFPDFGCEPRNLRLGLCADGFTPYVGNRKSKHSIWPVLLVIYNLPPSLCTKRKYVMLSMLISGPKQPGNDIDVYLAPLIEDLKKLWVEGVDVFDAYKKESFKLRAMIFTTINDFLAYGNLSGYSVKGHKACPICEADTHFHQLKHGKKTVYLGHRQFLHRYHPYRKLKKSFNGLPEHRSAPKALSGEEVYCRLKNVNVIFGKKQKRRNENNIWKKRSIFFDLPYWRFLDVRHSIDMMHLEKNVGESLIGTLLHIQGKTKDGLNARLDLAEMGIRQRLHPKVSDNGEKVYMEPASYTLSKEEKKSLCGCLHEIKVPTGYSSNVRGLVDMENMQLVGMKSHDYHVLMQQLLPISIRGIMRDDVRNTITRLCLFFHALCSKVVDPEKLDELENEGYIILSQLEMHFPPAFFDISVHLVVHLVREVRLCGPIYLRWMYPFEQFMKVLKGYSKNPNRPEASIVQRYLVEEEMNFCKLYLNEKDEKKQENEDEIGNGTRGIKIKNMSNEELMRAHLYILNNMKDVQPFLIKHKKSIKDKNPKKNDRQIANEHNKTFITWFKETVAKETNISETVKCLANGPRCEVVTWSGYYINGYSFCTKTQDENSTTQNSGVMVIAEAMHFSSSKDKNPKLGSMPYYGVIEEVWVVKYDNDKLKVPLFKCKWVNNNAVEVDRLFGFTFVDLNRVAYIGEPFILAGHAKQVFYVSDPANPRLSIVLQSKKQKDRAPTLSLDETPPICLNPSQISELELVDDDQYAVRNDHSEGIWDNT